MNKRDPFFLTAQGLVGKGFTTGRAPAHASFVQYPWCTERPGGEVPEWVYLGGVDPTRIKPK